LKLDVDDMNNKFFDGLEEHSGWRVSKIVEQRLAEIELALERGYTHRQILEQLHREGIAITPAYYHRLITRLRARAKVAAPTLDRLGTSMPGSLTSSITHVVRKPVSEIPVMRENHSASTRIAPPVPVPQTSGAKAHYLPVVLKKSSSAAASTINDESSGTKPFTWSGREFLDKDWSNF
jgi:hypothetical protein